MPACIATCIEDIHTSCAEGLVLNATSFLQCLPSGVPGKINETLYEECLYRALSTDASDCMQAKRQRLVHGVLCAHRCRSRSQIYEPVVSSMKGMWYGVAGPTTYDATIADKAAMPKTGNPLLLCHLSKSFAWHPSCFNQHAPLENDSHGTYGHPVTSAIVNVGDKVLLATLAEQDGSFMDWHERMADAFIASKAWW
jgi:hypothetical protein